jgi:hypothetical protein
MEMDQVNVNAVAWATTSMSENPARNSINDQALDDRELNCDVKPLDATVLQV